MVHPVLSSPEHAAHSPPSSTPRRRPRVDGRRPLVFLAEDDTSFRLLLVEVLRRTGYEVVSVGDGHSLVERLANALYLHKSELPDVIVSDIRMPGVDGLRALRWFSFAELRIPLVFMTAFPHPDTEADALSWGASAVMAKPFPIHQLTAKLAELTAA